MAKKEQKTSVGRPSKYKSEYCQMLIDHMASGLSFESFGAIAKVNQDTLHEWVKHHVEFSEAKSIAFDLNRLFWERLGIEHIVNKSESFPDNGGSVSKSLNSTVWIFNMKNRFPKEWRDKQEIETKQDITQRVVFDTTYGGKSLEELSKELSDEPKTDTKLT